MLQWKSFSLPKKNRVSGVVEEKNRRERNLAANTILVRFSTIESNFKKEIEVRCRGSGVEGQAWSDPLRSTMS